MTFQRKQASSAQLHVPASITQISANIRVALASKMQNSVIIIICLLAHKCRLFPPMTDKKPPFIPLGVSRRWNQHEAVYQMCLNMAQLTINQQGRNWGSYSPPVWLHRRDRWISVSTYQQRFFPSPPLVCFLYSHANVPPRSCQIGEFMLAGCVQSGTARPSSDHWEDAAPEACVGLRAKERRRIMKTKPHHLTVSPIRGNTNPLVRRSPGDAVHSHVYACQHKLRGVRTHTHDHTRRREPAVCCQVAREGRAHGRAPRTMSDTALWTHVWLDCVPPPSFSRCCIQ